MEKIKKAFFETVRVLLGIFFVSWMYYAVRSTYFNYGHLNEWGISFIILLGVLIAVFLAFPQKMKQLFMKLFKLIEKWRVQVVLVVFLAIVQIFIIFCASSLARMDTEWIFHSAIGTPGVLYKEYISTNPNNFLLLILYKCVNHIFGKEYIVFVLEVFNVCCLNFSILMLSHLCRKFISTKVATVTYILSFILLGCSPQYLITYSDIIVLPLVVLMIYFMLNIKYCENIKKQLIFSAVLGILAFLGYAFRPPVLIVMMAFGIYLLLNLKNSERRSKIKIILLIPFITFFVVFKTTYMVVAEKQSYVPYNTEKSKTILYFIDLGLTTNGANQSELPSTLVQATGEDRNIEAVKDIKNRLKKYRFETFSKHLLAKADSITSEGMFGWGTENFLAESGLQHNKIVNPIMNSKLGASVRKAIYFEGNNYFNYAFIMQVFWLILILGLIFSSYYPKFYHQKNFSWISLALFGGICFLMLFEGGRTRYLIQFSPMIFIMAGYGWSGRFSTNRGLK